MNPYVAVLLYVCVGAIVCFIASLFMREDLDGLAILLGMFWPIPVYILTMSAILLAFFYAIAGPLLIYRAVRQRRERGKS